MEDRFLDLTEFSLIWGPLELPEPAYSFADDWESQIYTPDEIADAIASVPGVILMPPAKPIWSGWSAWWREADRSIEFDIMACQYDSQINRLRPDISLAWVGSKFEMHCLLSDALAVWRHIRQRCPAVWLTDTDCRVYSPESFAREFAA